MRRVVECKQFLSLPNFKSIRLLHSVLHTDVTETQKSDQTATKSVASSSKRSCYLDASKLFDELPQWDVVSVTTLISQLTRQNRQNEAFYIFSKMLQMEITPNEYTLAALIHASTSLKNLNLGKQLHCYAIKTSFNPNVFVGTAVTDLYAKLNTIEEAQMVFDETHDPNVVSYTALVSGYIKKERFNDAVRIFKTMPEKNVVTWNAMIGGYSQKGHNEEAVNLFINMLREGIVPTQNTFPCVFSSAGNIAALGIGKSIHASAIKNLGKIGVFIGNSLITFYSKCGNMEDSLLSFHKIPDKNIVSWNALINGYAQNGRGEEAIGFYNEMKAKGVNPNAVTFLGLLSACNHSGLVEDGLEYFHETRMKNPSLIEPAHYACMVDLLARSGRFLEAERFIQDLPFDPGVGFWKALLGGCQIHMNMELGEVAGRKILDLDPSDVSSYVMLSNAHSVAGRWQNVLDVRREMKEKRMKRVPGCSWIEVGFKIHVFVNGDRESGDPYEIRKILSCVYDHVKRV
ncbi:pentatricopeptide repeat-containing protein At5g42450, mitochondrial [Lactuca sativa]|uniref:pentatricopeptide repeat-containing protein At5g42450, mitochondrial n=1 Tax=Lactuca sativa TaxID=4236 RepID=UPI000CB3533D|nr:pentatricopeptide repeat-containing protein At5g42450, mitochondrial [Lactuca sativa]